MKRSICIALLLCSAADAKPHPKLKHVAMKIHHALTVTGEVAICAVIVGLYVYSKGRS
jgi:hypothetical protein